MAATIVAPGVFHRALNLSSLHSLVGVQLRLPGRVFVSTRLRNDLNETLPAAEVLITSNSSDLVELVTAQVVNATIDSSIQEWKMQVGSNDPVLKLAMQDTSSRVQGSLLVHIILNEPVRSVATSAQTIFGDGTVLFNDSTGEVDIAAYGNENLWIESITPIKVKGMTLSTYGAGNIQFKTPSLTLHRTLDMNVFGIGSIAIEAAEAIVDSVESTIGGQGSIFVNGKYDVADMASHILGSGSINYYPHGSCSKSKVDIVGVGNINAGSWVCLRTHASVLGSGKAIVQVIDVLDVSGIGRGHIEYFNATPVSLPDGRRGFFYGPRVELALVNTYKTYLPLDTPEWQAMFVSVGPANSGWFRIANISDMLSVQSSSFLAVGVAFGMLVMFLIAIIRRKQPPRFRYNDSYFDVKELKDHCGIASSFTALKNPTFVDKLIWKTSKHHVHLVQLFVRIDVGMITVTENGKATDIAVAQHCTEIKLTRRRDVRIITRQGHVQVKYAFADRLSAVEFCGCVELIQHIDHLREARSIPETINFDKNMTKYTKATLNFAKEMWTLAMWRELWPYSGLLTSLESVLDKISTATSTTEVRAIDTILTEIHDQFYPHATINFLDDQDGIRYYRHDNKSGVACEYSIVKDPSLFDKMMSPTHSKNHAMLFVRIDNGSVMIKGNDESTSTIETEDLWVQVHGKKDVWIGTDEKSHTALSFENRISAIEFCAAIELIQHIAHLRHPRNTLVYPIANDPVLHHNLETMQQFVEEMWTLAMWRELWPYSNMIESIQECLTILSDASEIQEIKQMHNILCDLYNTFYPQANITFLDERDHIRFYRPSYLALFNTVVNRPCTVSTRLNLRLRLRTGIYLLISSITLNPSRHSYPGAAPLPMFGFTGLQSKRNKTTDEQLFHAVDAALDDVRRLNGSTTWVFLGFHASEVSMEVLAMGIGPISDEQNWPEALFDASSLCYGLCRIEPEEYSLSSTSLLSSPKTPRSNGTFSFPIAYTISFCWKGVTLPFALRAKHTEFHKRIQEHLGGMAHITLKSPEDLSLESMRRFLPMTKRRSISKRLNIVRSIEFSPEIVSAYEDIRFDGNPFNWLIAGYAILGEDEAPTLVLLETGMSGLQALKGLGGMGSSLIQTTGVKYIYIRLDVPMQQGTVSKYVLITWQSWDIGSPRLRSSSCDSDMFNDTLLEPPMPDPSFESKVVSAANAHAHAGEIYKFFQHHVHFFASTMSDISEEAIRERVRRSIDSDRMLLRVVCVQATGDAQPAVCIEIPREAILLDLKKEIARVIGIPEDRQRLVWFHTKEDVDNVFHATSQATVLQLDTHRLRDDIGLEHGDKIHVDDLSSDSVLFKLVQQLNSGSDVVSLSAERRHEVELTVEAREAELKRTMCATQDLLEEKTKTEVQPQEPSSDGEPVAVESTEVNDLKNQMRVLEVQKQYLDIPYETIRILEGKENELGIGKCATVYRGMWMTRKTIAEVAIKLFRYVRLTDKIMQDYTQEVALLRQLKHPNIVLFIGACINPKLMILTEYCSRKSLYSVIHNKAMFATIPWKFKVRMVLDAARGIAYLHSNRIIHRDIKSHNMLVDDDWRVKVADFGISKVLDVGAQAFTHCGTSGWVAPEVLLDEDIGYTFKADNWSFAIVMWEIIAGSHENPFLGMAPVKFYHQTINKGLRPEIDESVDSAYADLIRECWDSDPPARPSFSTIVERLETILSDLGMDTGLPPTFAGGYHGTLSGLSGERSPRSVIRCDIAEKMLQTPPMTKSQWTEYMGKHLYDICFRELRVTPKGRRFVIVEDLLFPRNLREAIVDVIFTILKAKQLVLVPAITSALYATYQKTALIVDAGWIETRILPVFERMPIISCYKTTGLASQYACAGLKGHIQSRGTSVEDILERACFVLPPTTEDNPLQVEDADFFSYTSKALKLPGTARHECLEALFTGTDQYISIPDTIVECIEKCPIDARKALIENIICIGGTSMLPGFRARLQHELQAEFPSATVLPTLFPPSLMSWVGASIYATTTDAINNSVTLEAYEKNPIVYDWMEITPYDP
ncbi:kinase [Thraustotheca clavata]|uniref:Kinase n=1 Tax=Thraustotheca clavata TaxID=74557 RepID=A0A1W0A6B6_9STRA|nr:kinase [Thraustotheca clavata]